MSDDIRSAVSSAFDSVSSSTPSPEPSAPETPAPEPVEAAPEAAEVSESPAAAEAKPAQVSAPKPGQPQAPVTAAPAEAAPVTPKVPEHKAPQSWKPAIREQWAKLPPEVQAEVVRREGEVQRLVQESAEHRKVASAFQQTLAPYMGMIQAERQDPVQAVAGLLQTAAALRTAPPAHKAALVAQIITGYGISTEDINAVLQGQQPAQEAHQPQHFDPNQLVAQAEQRFAQRLQAQAQQAQMRKAQSDLDAFLASGEAEFFDDVRPIMSSLLSAAAQSGIALSLKDAYSQAVAMSPDLKPVLQQREKAAQATASNAATLKAKNAAASVRSSPAPVSTGAPKDLRSELEANWAKLSR